MHKVRFKNTIPAGGGGGWDGVTMVNAPAGPFVLTGGFWEAPLPSPAGRMAAGLFTKAPGGDPYVVHVTMYSRVPPTSVDYFAVKTPSGNYRRLWTPFPGNTRAALVRPDDILEFKYALQGADDAWLELLLEPLADTNEFGPVLLDLLREEARENLENPTPTGEIIAANNLGLPLFAGVLRVTVTAGAAINLVLPDVSAMRLNHLLIVERTAALGVPTLVPAGGQTINGVAGGTAIAAVNTSVWLRGFGTDWSLV